VKTYNVFGLKIPSFVFIILVIFLGLVIVSYFWKRISLFLEDKVTDITEGTPTQKDYDNATIILNAWSYWNDDEDAVIGAVQQYTKATYPLLKKAYFSLTKENLTDTIKKNMSSKEYAPIIHIIE
jgi:hypothetical protein